MENKANQNPQSNQNSSAQSSSKTNTSTIGSTSQSGSSSNAGKSNWKDTFKKENLNNLTGKLQEFGNTTMNKVNGLSTTQKVVGGSLLALGAGWVAMNSMGKGKGSTGSKKASSQEKLNRNLNKNLNKNR